MHKIQHTLLKVISYSSVVRAEILKKYLLFNSRRQISMYMINIIHPLCPNSLSPTAQHTNFRRICARLWQRTRKPSHTGRTSRRSRATNGSAGSNTLSRKRPGRITCGESCRSSRKECAARAAGWVAHTGKISR